MGVEILFYQEIRVEIIYEKVFGIEFMVIFIIILFFNEDLIAVVGFFIICLFNEVIFWFFQVDVVFYFYLGNFRIV